MHCSQGNPKAMSPSYHFSSPSLDEYISRAKTTAQGTTLSYESQGTINFQILWNADEYWQKCISITSETWKKDDQLSHVTRPKQITLYKNKKMISWLKEQKIPKRLIHPSSSLSSGMKVRAEAWYWGELQSGSKGRGEEGREEGRG